MLFRSIAIDIELCLQKVNSFISGAFIDFNGKDIHQALIMKCVITEIGRVERVHKYMKLYMRGTYVNFCDYGFWMLTPMASHHVKVGVKLF